MRLYHYCTWGGDSIYGAGVIKPSRRYAVNVEKTVLDQWPLLTFLTSSPSWEPSLQSYTKDGHWERCGSYPETNEALGIPSWKFQINTNGLVLGEATDFKGCKDWRRMLEEAVIMGSNPDDWRIAVQDCYVIKTWAWRNDEWITLKNT